MNSSPVYGKRKLIEFKELTMSRGRKANLVPTRQWSIMVPIDLAFQVEAQLMDPVTKKASYAARSKLIQSLLYEWLKSQGVKPVIPAEALCPDCKRPKAVTYDDVVNGCCPKFYVPTTDENYPLAVDNCARHTQADLPLENSST